MAHLIELSPPDHRLDQAFLDAPGGFAWWYTDLVNEAGDGAVLIWSWGLPFLPGYASAERRGEPELPRSRPSLSVAIYSNGEPDFYLLQEFEPEDAAWDGQDRWRFGRSTFHSRVEGGRRILDITLDVDVPGSDQPLRGTYCLEGAARLGRAGEHSDDEHDWSPLVGPARGSLNAAIGPRLFKIDGRAYHDRNGGKTPMHQLGIKNWLWGRIPLADRERIYYVLWPNEGDVKCLGLDVFEDGRTELITDLHVSRGSTRWSYTGSRFPTSISLRRGTELWLDVEHSHTVDEGPFYLRWQVTARTSTEQARGIGEYVIPDAIDQDFMRPLVKMRVHHTRRENSIWLPLFSGPSQGRVKRLVESWVR